MKKIPISISPLFQALSFVCWLCYHYENNKYKIWDVALHDYDFTIFFIRFSFSAFGSLFSAISISLHDKSCGEKF